MIAEGWYDALFLAYEKTFRAGDGGDTSCSDGEGLARREVG